MNRKTAHFDQPNLFINLQVNLLNWEPEKWPVAPDWQPVVNRYLQTTAARQLGNFINGRLALGACIYPSQPFRALAETPQAQVKVVILGQDPYHGPGLADGLAFSVAHGVATAPSLRNIHKEIARDTSLTQGEAAHVPARVRPNTLLAWAQQGVLLLNTCLTVEKDQPASHTKQGWEALTDEIIKEVWTIPSPVVFMLWGAHAQAKQAILTPHQVGSPAFVANFPRLVLTANHPSPLSALRPPKPFIGCGHFGQANAFLTQHGQKPILW